MSLILCSTTAWTWTSSHRASSRTQNRLCAGTARAVSYTQCQQDPGALATGQSRGRALARVVPRVRTRIPRPPDVPDVPVAGAVGAPAATWPALDVSGVRILQVITSLTHGGAEHLLVNVVNRLVRRHEVTVVYLKGEPFLLPRIDPAVQVIRAPLGPSTVRFLRALMQSTRPDVLHTHLPHADFLGLGASLGVPGTRRVSTLHNIWYKWDYRDYAVFAGYRILYAVVVPDTDVIAISASVARHAATRLGVPASRLHLFRNTIPETVAAPNRGVARGELGLRPEDFVVLFVGRLTRQKSVHTLIEAAGQLRHRVPALKVLLVGEGRGYKEEELIALTASANLGDIVRFCGRTDAPERYLAAADVFVLPSVFEGLGLVVLEAFRAGVPVIASDVEGPAELIENGRNGLLFPPSDDQRLAALLQTLAEDPGLRERLGPRVARRSRHRSHWKPMCRVSRACMRGAPPGEQTAPAHGQFRGLVLLVSSSCLGGGRTRRRL